MMQWTFFRWLFTFQPLPATTNRYLSNEYLLRRRQSRVRKEWYRGACFVLLILLVGMALYWFPYRRVTIAVFRELHAQVCVEVQMTRKSEIG